MEYNPGKAFWFIYFFIIVLTLGYGYIGADVAQRGSLTLYVLFLALPGLVVVLFDWLTPEGKFDEIQTITVEEPHDGLEWFDWKFQAVVGIVIGVILLYRMSTTGAALVGAAKWSIFSSDLGNAIYSALISAIEDLDFFGIIMPTTAAILYYRYDVHKVVAALISIVVVIAAFMGYHGWRYGLDEKSMGSVGVFGLIGATSTYGSMSLLIIDIIHAFNNFGVGIGLADRVALGIIT